MTTQTAARIARIDWTMPDPEIGRREGVSREYVRQLRNAYGKPRGALKWAHHCSVAKTLKGTFTAEELIHTTAHQLAQKINSTARAMQKARGVSLGITPSHLNGRFLLPFHLLNWDLPNRDLAAVWGISVPCIANHRCTRHKLGARWCILGGIVPTDPAYFTALKQERDNRRCHNFRAFIVPDTGGDAERDPKCGTCGGMVWVDDPAPGSCPECGGKVDMV